ncbi:hypothetical protein COY95_04165 [Candidatus Woesearchaeota archaeon CG_4_10_14_0_8_um_filter_47_5]|nr:MAG: hypothetical protein COY95_04165 [Candidatus Woesearchaeota archaeon CG_4_10_14_0_8_um_filter_47_5]
MSLKKPTSMKELVYFTSRDLAPKGQITVWVFRNMCPKCSKGIMSKPADAKGKIKIRAKEYVCPSCGYTAESKVYEDSLMACVSYTCPHCGKSGEKEVPFKRKNVKGVLTLSVSCDACNGAMDVTKKMKGL